MVEIDSARGMMPTPYPFYAPHDKPKASCYAPGVRRRYQSQNPCAGLTLIELVIVMAIIATLASLALPAFNEYINRAKIARAISEIRILHGELYAIELNGGKLPVSLEEINRGVLRDPWGNPYQYTNFKLSPKGKWRKDKFLVPINSTFDLWSMGPDGETAPPLTAKKSQDDVIRANDGSFIGVASRY